jgi:clan AA aspartic protease (TIGR02281 family)
MSKASFESDEAPPQPVEANRPGRPGRTLTMALVAACITVLATLAISGTVITRAPTIGAKAATHSGSSTTFFYHASNEQSFRARTDGQIYLDAKVNDRQVHFRVDQTVSRLLLTPSDARAAGLTQTALNYSGRAMTANGEVAIAPVTIQYLQLGTLTLFNVQAAVAETSLPESILGMDFLKRFDSYEMKPEKLVLHW